MDGEEEWRGGGRRESKGEKEEGRQDKPLRSKVMKTQPMTDAG